jgi:RimJ/RimL family protein N-acetyltransferase
MGLDERTPVMEIWGGTAGKMLTGKNADGHNPTLGMIGHMTLPRPSFAAKPTLVGKRVLLRPVVAADAPGLVELLNDPEVRRLTGTHGQVRPGALERAERWYASSAAKEDRLDLAIVEQATGGYVGEVALSELDADNLSCSFRIALVGPRAVGRGLGSEASRLVLGYAFDTVGLHRISLEVYDFNPRARHVYEKIGFVHEGTQRQALYWQGAWVDAHLMAILSDEWPEDG